MQASAGWYGDHTVDATSEGVTVRKGLDLDTLALPALKFELRSDRDDPVGVTVVDRLPSTIDPNRVGVHTDFAADQWTAFEDGRVAFTTRLDPERPVVTLYGVWMDDPSRITEFFGQPDLTVSSDPDAASLAPSGDEVHVPTVDDSLRSVGPKALEDLRSDVEEALTGVRAEPEEDATALPAPGVGADDDEERSTDGLGQPAGTMGDHAWTYPVERMGTGRVAAPTHADLADLVDDDVGGDHVYLRAALAETHHGGGGALLLQELANAFEVVARRVTGDDERATVDAVVHTPLGTEAVLSALAERDQVTDALVSPLVGDPGDATGIDAEPTEETATAEKPDTEEVSIEPESEDVEVVLNADGERFSELKDEFELETDTDALESELADMELPGVDTSAEPTIDELVDGEEDVDADASDDGFVPASVDGDGGFQFDAADANAAADASGLDFTADEDAFTADEDATETGGDTPEPTDAVDVTTTADAAAAEPDGEADQSADDADADQFGAADFEFDDNGGFEAGDDENLESDDEFDREDEAIDFDADASLANDSEDAGTDRETDDADPDGGEATDGESENAPATVEVRVDELAAIRTELCELRDRVAALESELAAVRQGDSHEDSSVADDSSGGRSGTPEAADGGIDIPDGTDDPFESWDLAENAEDAE